MTKRTRSFVIAAAVSGAFRPELAAAQSGTSEPSNSPEWRIQAEVGASINNAGLQNTLEVARRQPLRHSPDPIAADAHVSAGLTQVLTPAHTSVGGWVEYSPSVVLQMRAGVQRSAYFGTFGSLMGFDRSTDTFDRHARELRGGARPGTSTRIDVTPVFRLPVGPILLYAGHGAEFWKSNADHAFFYEPTRDVLLTTRGDLLVTFNRGILYRRTLPAHGTVSAGVFHSGVYAAGSENESSRVGVVATREFAGSHFRVPRPRISFVVVRYLEDRSKAGQFGGAVTVGFQLAPAGRHAAK
jgi:hypothetical protein